MSIIGNSLSGMGGLFPKAAQNYQRDQWYRMPMHEKEQAFHNMSDRQQEAHLKLMEMYQPTQPRKKSASELEREAAEKELNEFLNED